MFSNTFKTQFSTIPEQLSNNGYWASDNIFNQIEVNLIESAFNENIKNLKPAQISKGGLKNENSEIRNDKNYWVDQQNDKFPPLWALLDKTSNLLRHKLYLPIKRYESQLALYPPGHFYKRHVDKHQYMPSRLITSVFYISNWDKNFGGELIIHKDKPVVIPPQKNSFVLFLSEIEHEVLPCKHDRKSITSWFRDDIL